MKTGQGVSEEMSFKGVDGRRTDDGRTDDDGRRTASDHNSSFWAVESGELKYMRLG